VTTTASLSPVVKYHGLARRYLAPPRFLMRPLLNGGTLGGRQAMTGRRFKRVVAIVLVGAAALYGAYLADTVGEASITVRGVVTKALDGQLPQDTRVGRRTVTTHQILIAVPGKTFWWNEELPVGSGVAVHLVEGRFSHHWYVQKVEPSAIADFNDALDDFNETVKRIRDELGH
jgi:hypothetical protein